MKAMIEKLLAYSTQEYDIFFRLPRSQRLKGAGAVFFFYLSIVCLSHLALRPFLNGGAEADGFLYQLYAGFLLVALISILPILFPPFQKYRSVVMYLSFFWGLLLALFYGISLNQVLVDQPVGVAVKAIWTGGFLAILFGLSLYSSVMKEVVSEKSHMEAEIQVARRIQTQLVPEIVHDDELCQIYGRSLPAREVGGDFFDVVRLSETRLAVAIGDVSGHNIAAGLLMAILKGAFRTELQYMTSLEHLARSLNRTILENSDKQMFVSFMCGIFDFGENSLSMVNAGHLPLLQYRAQKGEVVQWNPAGMAFGLSKSAKYQLQKTFYKTDDVFIFITDGLEESVNPAGEEYGLARIEKFLAAAKGQGGPRELYQTLIADVREFTGPHPARDDLTFLGLKVKNG